ncbi:formyltransferase family protein [Gammaproteobacteria bacterium]|nr:formyltransferase family protein [Gammaproteobacteria bacterium]
MRIVFIGAVEFSRRALECLIEINANIVGVCTLKESKFNADHVDLNNLSDRHEIPCLYAEDINSSKTLSWIQEKEPDVIFCFGWSRLIKIRLLNCASLGVIGFHPTALPANRGRHPLIWALVLGLKNTASTFFFMDAEADSGDILSQYAIKITENDNALSLYQKVTQTALQQIKEFLPQLEGGTFNRYTQEQGLANIWRKRKSGDGKIDWRMSANSIHDLVRGLSKPYVGAHFVTNAQEIKVWTTRIITDVPRNIEPGKVFTQIDSVPVVKCGEDAICLLAIEPSFELIEGSYL